MVDTARITCEKGVFVSVRRRVDARSPNFPPVAFSDGGFSCLVKERGIRGKVAKRDDPDTGVGELSFEAGDRMLGAGGVGGGRSGSEGPGGCL